MRKWGLLLGLGCFCVGGASWALASEPIGTSVKVRVEGERTQLEVRQVFPKIKSLEEIRATLTDPDLLPQVSRTVISSKKLDIQGSTYKSELIIAKRKAGMTFRLVTVYACEESETEGKWMRDCRLLTDASGRDGGKYLVDSRNQLSCSVAQAFTSGGGHVICTYKVSARPRPINYVVFSRTPQQLGISGANEAIHDQAALFLVAVSHLTPAQAKTTMEAGRLAAMNERMHAEGYAWAASNNAQKKSFTAIFSDIDGSYNTWEMDLFWL